MQQFAKKSRPSVAVKHFYQTRALKAAGLQTNLPIIWIRWLSTVFQAAITNCFIKTKLFLISKRLERKFVFNI